MQASPTKAYVLTLAISRRLLFLVAGLVAVASSL
jgi:hypothetical protein